MCRLILTLIFLTTPLGATPVDGVYDGFDCTAPVSDQRVMIQGDQLIYYESSCRLTDPQTVEGWEGATLYWANCRGEGQDWRERTLLMTRMGGDLIVIGDGWAERYAPCLNQQQGAD
ncbi:MAG: hypothetical protein KBT70_08320 [Roseovarius sp.]|uniref:hypothetical protein n=1 Tax=Roseovarius TaxID=74030 RepID=UPI001B757A24|nr:MULTISPECIES: hypothetical protein [Roseovarius]MBQ0750193.1 hypothetical protein [Roseovarius sp.]MBW4976240.1 hypothetical protein [Roseovarius mucosus]